MANNPHLQQDGAATKFSSTRQPATQGRKPRLLKRYIKSNNIGIEDQVAIFEEIIGNYTAPVIKQMVQTGMDDKGKPLSGLVWGFLVAWLSDNKRGWSAGGINMYFRDRRFGKTPDKLITLTEDLTQLTPEERDAEFERLYQEHHDSLRGRSDATAGPPEGAPGRSQETEQGEPCPPESADH